jgi:hypothetical protein
VPQQADLPVSFERKFRPWRYAVSHSELKLRSVDTLPTADVIEITFYGVVGMKIATVYSPLKIAVAETSQIEEMARLAGLKGSQSSRVKYLAMKSSGEDGLVACLSYTIWSLPRDLNPDLGGVPQADSVLILMG